MSSVQLHLLVNHLPVLGSVFGVLLLAAGLLWRSDALKRAGLAAMAVVAIAVVIANQSGEGAEETVEHLPGVSHRQIHEHEEAAETAGWVLIAAGVVGAAGLAVSLRGGYDRRVPTWAVGGSLLVGAVGAVMVALAAHQGGLIRHPELLPEGAAGAPAAAEGSERGEAGERGERR